MKKTPKHDRNPDNTTITVAISKSLLKLVDEAAAEEQRNRSNYIVYQLTKSVARSKVGNHTGCAASGCGQKDELAS